MTKSLSAIFAIGLSATTVALSPSEARACGGFFCSQTPVAQSGEQILFGMNPDGSIEAHILISYTGPASEFAWLLPVASTPTIELGTQAAFTTVGYQTRPSWTLEWQNQSGQCSSWQLQPSFTDEDGGDPSPGGNGDVTVVAQKDVGPFATVVLESASTDSLVAWLNKNDYAQPPEATPLLSHYVQQKMQFVAVRLKKDEPTGAIQPIVLKFREADPCVPLVLTQIAATPNMPVQVFLFGEHRVVPTNWMHVTLNERRIDWINNGANYTDVVTAAVDEAAGHGFVTEYAGAADRLAESLYREGQYDTGALANLEDPAAFVAELLRQGFPRDSTMQSLLREHIPMPQSLVDQGVTEQQFYNDLESYADALAEAGFFFDEDAFVADLEERVIAPLRGAQALFDGHAYLTRLFTTVSPSEMDRDPVFAQNPQLGDVSNLHRARATATCEADGDQIPDEVTIELADGDSFVVKGPFTPGYPVVYDLPNQDERAALRIDLVGRNGLPITVGSGQAEAVDDALDVLPPEQVLLSLTDGTITDPPHGDTSRGACSGGGDGGAGTGLAIGLAAALLAVLSRIGASRSAGRQGARTR